MHSNAAGPAEAEPAAAALVKSGGADVAGVVFLSNPMGSVEYAVTGHDSAVYLKRGEKTGWWQQQTTAAADDSSSRRQCRAVLGAQHVPSGVPRISTCTAAVCWHTAACAGFTTRRVASSLTGFVQHLLA
jgi:hypothetical protein